MSASAQQTCGAGYPRSKESKPPDCTLTEHDKAVRLATDLLGARLIDDRITPGRREK